MVKIALRIFTVLVILFCLLGVASFYVKPAARITTAQVREVYAKLVINAGESGIPPLNIVQDDTVNAWTDGDSVTITSGILDTMTNLDEVALVLSHEIAHAMNHDPSRTDQDTVLVEAHADKMGAFLMMKAGFDICKGRQMFVKFEQLYGDTALVVDHPGFAYRADQLNMPWCHYGY